MMKTRLRLGIGVLGVILLLLSIWFIWSPRQNLVLIETEQNNVPLTVIFREDLAKTDMPIVLIGHGVAGSSVFMRGFAYTMAYAGYATVSWDFDGHGRNPNPFVSGGDLASNAESALAKIKAMGIGDPSRTAILGHSMGSGVAMTFGQRYPDTQAVIAVSPVGTTVTPELPQNLLLLAGENEASFVRNAEARLKEAGGAGGDVKDGTGRKLQIIPYVEHISIVFTPVSHAAAVEWLDAVFGAQPGAESYTDRRVLWYGLGVMGVLFAAASFIPASISKSEKIHSKWRKLLALLGGAFGATMFLWIVEKMGFSLARSFGLMVGGYLLVWFGLAGLLAILFLGGWRKWLWLPGWTVGVNGLIAATALWLGVGLLGSEIWLPWLLIPERLSLWPLGVGMMLPWFLVVGHVSSTANGLGRAGWWLAQSIIIVGCLILALRISSGLSFLMLILPVFPILLGVHAFAAGRQRNMWAFGISAALFTSWAVLAVFPVMH